MLGGKLVKEGHLIDGDIVDNTAIMYLFYLIPYIYYLLMNMKPHSLTSRLQMFHLVPSPSSLPVGHHVWRIINNQTPCFSNFMQRYQA